MQRQQRHSTTPELLIRRELHARGLRFRVGIKVPGNARRTIDIAFTRRQLAVFVDGCFWHRCPAHSVRPKHNAAWWDQKLATNVARDRDTTELLTARGWHVLRVWEHEDPIKVADGIVQLLSELPDVR